MCDRNKLDKALSVVSRAVSKKVSTVEGVLVSIENGKLELTGYDLEFGIRTCIDIQCNGSTSFTVDGQLLGNIIKKISCKEIQLELQNNDKGKDSLVIRGGNAEYKIRIFSSESYPTTPDVNSSIDRFTVPQGMLKNMIKQTIFAVSTSDNKPILTGELFDIKNKIFNLVALDGYRLAVRTEPINADHDYNFVVPAKTLSEVSKILKDNNDETVIVYVCRRHIIFEIENYIFFSRLLEGEYHNYQNSIPSHYNTEVILNTRDLIASVERCMLLVNEKNKSPVICSFDKNVKISCSTSMGDLQDNFEADVSGGSVRIGFNGKFLLDALKSSESDKVKLQLNGSRSPMKIVPIDGDAYTFLVLPVRLREEN